MNVKLLLLIFLNLLIIYYLVMELKRTSKYSTERFYHHLYTVLSSGTLNEETFHEILDEYAMLVRHITGDKHACGTLRIFDCAIAFGYERKNPYVRSETLPIYFQYDMRDCHAHSGCRSILGKRRMTNLKYFTLNTIKLLDDYANPKPFADYNYTLLTQAPSVFRNAA